MTTFQLVAVVLTFTAALAYVNSRLLRLPSSVGISIAMALARPANGARDVILVMTCAVVAFSILVQGLTFGPVLRRLARGAVVR